MEHYRIIVALVLMCLAALMAGRASVIKYKRYWALEISICIAAIVIAGYFIVEKLSR